MKHIKKEDLQRLNDYQHEIYETALRLMEAFDWRKTPQGFDYWQQVYDNLIDIVNADIAAEKGLEVR